MPLQIRRGTEAERLAMVPKLANGELLWITDAKKLYVGDGVTASSALVSVTGFNTEDAQDAAAALFTTAPTHSGISFSYDDLAGKLTATIDLTDYQGVITASSFNGSLVANDSTLLVDGESGTIVGPVVANVTGNVTGNLTGNVTGNLTGNVTGNLTGNSDGYHTGDVKGSVFADNSSILVDAIDRIFYGTIDTGNTIIDTDSLTGTDFYLGTTSSILSTLTFNIDNNLTIRTITDPVNGKFVTMNQSRGTLASPSAVQAGDELGGVLVKAYTNSSTSAIAGVFGFVVDSTAVIAGGSFIKSKAVINASTDTGSTLADSLILDSAGIVSSNAFSATKYFKLPVYANDAARLASIPTPAAGMMVFMTSGTTPAATNQMQVFDGTNWVNAS